MDFEAKKQRAQEHADKVLERRKLYEIKHSNDAEKKIPTHKIITFYLFVLFNIILIYALVAMWHFADLTHLGVIIADIGAQILTFFIYSHHSTAQNTSGGIVYDTAMFEMRNKYHSGNDLTEEEKENAVG